MAPSTVEGGGGGQHAPHTRGARRGGWVCAGGGGVVLRGMSVARTRTRHCFASSRSSMLSMRRLPLHQRPYPTRITMPYSTCCAHSTSPTPQHHHHRVPHPAWPQGCIPPNKPAPGFNDVMGDLVRCRGFQPMQWMEALLQPQPTHLGRPGRRPRSWPSCTRLGLHRRNGMVQHTW
jgi:hypothetical protein